MATNNTPINADEWAVRFAALKPQYERFANKLASLLTDILRQQSISCHAIEHRAKSVDSFKEKITRAGKDYSDPLAEVTDLAGLRCILYYQEDVEKFVAALQGEFEIDVSHSVDKRSVLAPDQFGYLSVHVVLSLNRSRHKLPEWAEFFGFKAEVQVRTVLQHAWASISHALQYKHEPDIPNALRRKLIRLAGILELADEQFSEVRSEQAHIIRDIDRQIKSNTLDLSVNALSVLQYLKYSPRAARIGKCAAAAGFNYNKHTAFHDREPEGQLTRVLSELGIRTIDKLDEELRRLTPKAKKYFIAFANRRNHLPAGGNADHWIAVLVVGMHPEVFTLDTLNRMHLWSADYRSEVLTAMK